MFCRGVGLEKRKGITLVELVVGIVLITMLLSVFFGMLSSGLRQSEYAETHVEAERTVRYVVDKVVQDLRFADTVQLASDTGYNILRFRDLKANQYYLYIYNKSNKILYRQSANYNNGLYTAVGTPQPVTGMNVSDGSGTKISNNIVLAPESGTDIFALLPNVNGRDTATIMIDIVATNSGYYGQQGYSYKVKTAVANIGNIMP